MSFVLSAAHQGGIAGKLRTLLKDGYHYRLANVQLVDVRTELLSLAKWHHLVRLSPHEFAVATTAFRSSTSLMDVANQHDRPFNRFGAFAITHRAFCQLTPVCLNICRAAIL